MTALGTVVFEDQVFDQSSFRNQCMIGVEFLRCSIRRCDFSGADLSYAVFRECDLYETKFLGTVLYFSRIFDCDATKADFTGSLLNGIRVRSTDITHAEFGTKFLVGKNRKSIAVGEATENFLSAAVRGQIPNVGTVESKYDGILCEETGRAIRFADDPPDEQWRTWRRRSEVAKTVERLLVENGYKDRSLAAYYRFRYCDTRAQRGWLRKAAGLLILEGVWGYGVKIARPIVAWISMTIVFSIVYAVMPIWTGSAGLYDGSAPIGILQAGKVCWSCVAQAAVFSFQVSSLSVYGDVKAVGIAELVALIQQLAAVVLVGLGVATITRRVGNI